MKKIFFLFFFLTPLIAFCSPYQPNPVTTNNMSSGSVGQVPVLGANNSVSWGDASSIIGQSQFLPEVDLLTSNTMKITNGPVITFPSTTAMWVNLATNAIWWSHTNIPGYPIGGIIKILNGDNIINTNIVFGNTNTAFTNMLWSWTIDGESPINTTIQFTLTNSPVEGLMFFGYPITNANTFPLGTFKMSNVGLFAPNQSNDIVFVDNAMRANFENVYAGTSNNLYTLNNDGTGRSLVLGNVGGVATLSDLTLIRVLSRTDCGVGSSVNGMVLNGGKYGLVLDCDHATVENVQGAAFHSAFTGKATNAAIILARVNMELHIQNIHAQQSDCGIAMDKSKYPYFQNFMCQISGYFKDIGVTYDLALLDSAPGGSGGPDFILHDFSNGTFGGDQQITMINLTQNQLNINNGGNNIVSLMNGDGMLIDTNGAVVCDSDGIGGSFIPGYAFGVVGGPSQFDEGNITTDDNGNMTAVSYSGSGLSLKNIQNTNVVQSTLSANQQGTSVTLWAGTSPGNITTVITNASFTISSFVPAAGAAYSSRQLNVSNSSASQITVTISTPYSPYNASTTASVPIAGGTMGYFFVDNVSGGSTNLADAP